MEPYKFRLKWDTNARHFIWSPTYSFLLASSAFISSHAKIGRDFYKDILLSHAKKYSVYSFQAKLKERLRCSLNEALCENTFVKLSSTLFSHISEVGSVSYQQRYNQMWSLVTFVLGRGVNVLFVMRKTWSDSRHSRVSVLCLKSLRLRHSIIWDLEATSERVPT
jgi:hypothetical protein